MSESSRAQPPADRPTRDELLARYVRAVAELEQAARHWHQVRGKAAPPMLAGELQLSPDQLAAFQALTVADRAYEAARDAYWNALGRH